MAIGSRSTWLLKALPHPVTLEKIKAERSSPVVLLHLRLGVMPVSANEYRAILDLSQG
jgi:predicted RNA-binding protein with PUA-like domain